MSDLIERQAAKEAYCKKFCHPGVLCPDSGFCREVDEAFDPVPSAQPEIVRCKDCKWYELPSHKITENCVRWMKSNGILLPIKPNDYCSYAERRTDDCV